LKVLKERTRTIQCRCPVDIGGHQFKNWWQP